MADSMGSAPAWQRRSLHRDARPQRLAALDNDLIADGEPLLDDHARAASTGGLHAADSCLAVIDHEDIGALLVRDQRRLRNNDLFLRRPALQPNAHQLTIN